MVHNPLPSAASSELLMPAVMDVERLVVKIRIGVDDMAEKVDASEVTMDGGGTIVVEETMVGAREFRP